MESKVTTAGSTTLNDAVKAYVVVDLLTVIDLLLPVMTFLPLTKSGKFSSP